ncbi:MAG: response regulator transcription factor [Reichenbachiella sp.]
MTRILLAEDEPSMRLGLTDNLEFEGYEVIAVPDGKQALDTFNSQSFDLAILDVMMPEMSGFDVCKTVRASGNNTPIVFLTAKGDEIDRVLGLEFGADDYIAKPFSLRELLARIKAILRRSQLNTSNVPNQWEQIGCLSVDFSRYEAKIGSEEVKFSHREFDVLQFLWKHRQKIVSRDQLLKNIWGYDEFPTTRTIDNFILRIRQRVEENPNDPKIILTVHGQGYKIL